MRPISYSLDKIPKIVRVCSILHNICVDRSVKNNPVLQYDNKGNRHWAESAEHDCVFDADPQDAEIMERLHNVYSESRRASSDNSVKKKLMSDIYDAGIRMRNDTEFHPMN